MADVYCHNCHFYCKSTDTCDYWLIEDRLRGCPPGDGCQKKMTTKEYRKKMANKWDKEAGKKLWEQGKNDRQIAKLYGVSVQAVAQIRKKYWEETPAEPVQEPEPEETQSVQVSATVPPVDPAPADSEEDDAQVMFRALEIMTRNLTGMNAVATAQIVTNLWDWKTVEDLQDAQNFLDYLIGRAAK